MNASAGSANRILEQESRPFLTQPWQAGILGWIVVFGALLLELVLGIVTSKMSMAVAAPLLIAPAAIAVGFGIAQWLQARSIRDEPASWWHFIAVAAALFSWQAWPYVPSQLQPIANAHDACTMMYTATADCVARATSAMDDATITWWVTGALIIAVAPLARRSRIAAWSVIPLALAGSQLAGHFLELLLLHYHVTGA